MRMAANRRLTSFLFGFASLALVSACGLPGNFGAMVEGNARFRHGAYEAAAAAYLNVHDPSWRAAVDYDLANTWAMLGEDKAAESLYAVAAKGGGPSLRRDAWYNLGLLRLEGGRWEESWAAFREALRLDPRDAEARRGLEIAWRAWKKQASAAPTRPAPAAGASFGGVSEDIRLLRRLETGSWRPGSSSAPASGARDW
ncbi:MAG TPA: tetratricopeptide repeat protein [Rectinemataceae bacterium]|nr:tetratricopeptide repeat protein [Rectinemataceae bacterium]